MLFITNHSPQNNETMKKTIFLLIVCCLTAACSSEKKKTSENSPSNDPIENLLSYLDEQQTDIIPYIEYEGGSFLKTKVHYHLSNHKTWDDGKKCKEVLDSCLSAFRWGCSFARRCYHKENHVLDKDTVLYALALEGADGEKIELQGSGNYEFYNLDYKAARAATLRYQSTKEYADAEVDYITREATGAKEETFNITPFTDFIKRKMTKIDGVKVYNTYYECTAEDWDFDMPLIGDACTAEGGRDGITTGHLYVFPDSDMHIKDEFDSAIRYHMHSYPQQTFYITGNIKDSRITFYTIKEGRSFPLSKTKAYKHKMLYCASSDNHFYILVLDETIGAFCTPSDWMHTLRIKNHKAEYIPGYEPPTRR